MKSAIFLASFNPNGGIGGAEKRFFGLWMNFQKRNINCRLVMYQATLNEIIETGEFKDIDLYRKNILFLPETRGFAEKHKMISAFIKENFEKNEVLHFILYYPVLHRLPNPTIFSDVYSNIRDFTFKDHITTQAAHLRATAIDILDPVRGNFVKKKIFWNSQKVKITTNTFVDTKKYKPAAIKNKKNWLVFVGRFVKVKQIERLMKFMPQINQMLQDAKIKDVKFFIFGHGDLESVLKDLLQQPEYANVDIEMRYEPAPYEILSQAKIGFSLQKVTNYPSKSLAEILACGCLPIVTDNGTTRLMAKPEFSYYVPEDFSAEDIANKAKEIFNLTSGEFEIKTRLAAEFAENELSIDRMTDYFLDLYKTLYH